MKRVLLSVILITLVLMAIAQTTGWVEVVGSSGLNYNYSTGGQVSAMCTDTFGNLYASGEFSYGQILKWNGTNWNYEFGTGNNLVTALTCDAGNNIYASSQHGAYQAPPYGSVYIVGWNSTTNTFLTNLNNYNNGAGTLDSNYYINTLYSDTPGHILAGGFHFDTLSNNVHIPAISYWNGNNWSPETVSQLFLPYPTSVGLVGFTKDEAGNLYALGEDGYVCERNDTGWIIPGNEMDSLPLFNGKALCRDNYGNIYAAGFYQVCRYNGTKWSKIGDFSVPNVIISCICADGLGNIYAGGYIPGKYVPYIYKWDGIAWNNLNADGKINGNAYPQMVLCTDKYNNLYAGGSLFDDSGNLFIAKYTALLNVDIPRLQPLCLGSNIIINPVVTGYYPPFTYQWLAISGDPLSCTTCKNPGMTLSQSSIYVLIVTDSLGDTASTSITYIVDTVVNSLHVSLTNAALSCSSDSASIQVTGAHNPYSISWSDNGPDSNLRQQSVNHIYDTASIFIITVRDSSGCVSALFDTVPLLEVQLLQNANWGCAGLGQLNATGVSGSPPYHYKWSNDDSTSLITNLAQGNYSITVTDLAGCSVSASYTIQHVYYYASIQAADANCSNNGAIQTTITGGTSPYSYLWSNDATTSSLSSLGKGIYQLTITDATGCETTGYGTVNQYCASIISGKIFIDSARTCYYIGAQPGLPYVILTLSGGAETQYATTDYNGNYCFTESDAGTFYLSVQVSPACGNFTLCGNPSQTINVSGLGDSSSNNNFAFDPASASFDLSLHPGWSRSNPGFEKDFWIYFGNNSPVPYNGSVTVAFKYDPNLVFLSSDMPYTTYDSVNDSIIWIIDNFNNSNWNWIGDIRFMVPESLSPDYLLHSQFWIYPKTADCDTSNNYLNYYDPVTGSHDPNSKTVSPAGNINSSDSVLIYTINYQNTGTDSTYFIIVRDTLSPYLDPATVRNLAGSDKYSSFAISGTGILTWTFNPLRLPDSTTNTATSKGFIVYSVKPKASLPLGIAIANSASIYFDYNPPVVTDTIINAVCSSQVVAVNASICNGQSYKVGYISHLQSGNYLDTIQNFYGCDSIVSLKLSVDTITAQLSQLSPDTLFAAGSGNITWMDCSNNQLVAGETSGIFIARTTGTYAAIITSGNCSDTTDCLTAIVNGIAEINENKVHIYPNPSSNSVNIVLSQSVQHTVGLYDMKGALLFAQSFQGLSEKLDLSSFSDGVYFITINVGEWSVRQKLVKVE